MKNIIKLIIGFVSVKVLVTNNSTERIEDLFGINELVTLAICAIGALYALTYFFEEEDKELSR